MSDGEPDPDDAAGGDAARAEAPGIGVSEQLLAFQQAIVEELLESDGLTIIGATQAQREQVAAELRRLCPTARAIADVTAEMTASQRSALLHAAEHLFITTRILVVDLLTQRLPTHQVAGLLILNAHRATEQSGEGFAVRLLRAGNKSAFVRGLSDEPGLASRGLSSLERTLRALHVREVFLWPRFRSDVQDNMHAVDVHEMECELSGPMATIQLALVKVLDGMLRQVQRGNKLDSSELALSHAFSRNFDATIKQQLNSIWNTVSQATRALIKDLRTVQDLLRYLLRFNCVSFLRYLQCLRAAAGPNTEWLMLSAANTVFQEAKARVYKVDNAPGRGSKPQLQPVLEEQPKWLLLQHVAEEIQTQRGMLASHAHADDDAHTANGGASTSGRTAPPASGQRHDRRATDAGGVVPGARAAANGGAAGGAEAAGPDDEEPCTPRAGHSPVKESLLEASPGLRVISAGGDEDGGQSQEDSTAWIQRLSAAQAQECADAPVLVVAKEQHLLTELRSILAVHGGKSYLQKLYDMYLLERLSSAQRESGLARDGSGDASTSGRGRGRGRGRGGAGRVGRGGRAGPTRKEQGMYKLQMLNATPDEETAMAAAASSVLDAFNENDAASASPRSKKRAAPAAAAAAAAPRKRQKGSSDVSRARDATGASIARDAEGPLLQGFHFVASEDAQEGVLHEVQPLFVVLYDVDLVWIRMLECYQSLHPDRPVQAYMLSYHDSVEVAKFQQSASREKQAFLSLIQKKGHMVLPVDEAGNVATLAKPQSELARNQQLLAGGARLQAGNAVTRRAGGHAALRAPAAARVVVDVREFMSQLPAVLHSRGLDVAPVTLEVGDFVLTAAICVERKAIPDLISSLDSGRLFAQAQVMSKHYATPVLLIEFDPDKAFALQSAADVGTDIRASNLASKLVLLLLNFPKLRVVWSRSLHATADMFSLLKSGQEEPDAKVAAEVGLEDAEAMGSDVANPTARDMLLRMPGVTASNVHAIMELAGSLAGLADVGVKDLQRVMGASGGKALHAFLAAPCQV